MEHCGGAGGMVARGVTCGALAIGTLRRGAGGQGCVSVVAREAAVRRAAGGTDAGRRRVGADVRAVRASLRGSPAVSCACTSTAHERERPL